VCAVLGLHVGGGASAGASAPPRVQLALRDVLGEAVALGAPEPALPTIVFFMSKRSQDEAAALVRTVDEQTLDRAIELVGVVDVQRYGGFWRRLAQSRLERSARDARARRTERRVARGVDASAAAVNRWHLVGDFEGALFTQFGVEREPSHPVAFVIDRGGALRGPFRDAVALVAAVAR
jgi:hypothetical protein